MNTKVSATAPQKSESRITSRKHTKKQTKMPNDKKSAKREFRKLQAELLTDLYPFRLNVLDQAIVQEDMLQMMIEEEEHQAMVVESDMQTVNQFLDDFNDVLEESEDRKRTAASNNKKRKSEENDDENKENQNRGKRLRLN